MKIAAKGRKGTKEKEWERRRRDSFEFLTTDKGRCSIDNGIARIFWYGAKNPAMKVANIHKKMLPTISLRSVLSKFSKFFQVSIKTYLSRI